MDIEGVEPNALRGAAATLARYRPHLSISLEHRPSDPDTIPPLIRSLYPGAKMKPSSCVNLGIIQPNVVFVD